MNHILWVPDEHARELRSTIIKSWMIAGTFAVLSLIAFMSSVGGYISGRSTFATITLVFVSLAFSAFFVHALGQALAHSRHIQDVFNKQEQDIKNETVLMLAEIEVELNGK